MSLMEGLDQIDATEALNTYRGASLVMGGDGVQEKLNDLAKRVGLAPASPDDWVPHGDAKAAAAATKQFFGVF